MTPEMTPGITFQDPSGLFNLLLDAILVLNKS